MRIKVAGRVGMAVAGLIGVAGLAMPAAGQIDPAMQPSLEGEIAWPEASNAAPIYWRAFFSYSTSEDLKGVDWGAMRELDDATGYELSATELEQLAKAEGVIATALRASGVEPCNWEIDYDQGIGALLPHLGPMRNLTRLFAADVRRCVGEGDLDGAVDRLVAMHAFSRSVRGDGVLISSLVSCAIANLAADETTELLARVDLTAEQKERLIGALDAYGEEDPFAVKAAIANEGVWMTAWLAQEIREGRLRKQMDFLFSMGDGGNSGEIERISRMADEALIEDLRQCRQYYADAVSIWDQADAADRLAALGEMVMGGRYGRFATILAAALEKSKQSDDRCRAALADSRREIESDATAGED